MKNIATRTLTIAVAALLLATTVAGDTIVLRDGRRFQGQLISVQNGVVEFADTPFGGGRVARFNRNDVVGIEFDRAYNNDRSDRNNGYDRNNRGAPQRGRSGLREKQIMVGAEVRWVDTNIDVQAGQGVYFEANGEVRWGPSRRDGPAGEQNSPNNPARPIPNRPAAALIGRVGANSQDYFFIGANNGPIQMRSSGRLFLTVNDDFLQDNSGAFRVVVYY
jgi:hypothetical protein